MGSAELADLVGLAVAGADRPGLAYRELVGRGRRRRSGAGGASFAIGRGPYWDGDERGGEHRRTSEAESAQLAVGSGFRRWLGGDPAIGPQHRHGDAGQLRGGTLVRVYPLRIGGGVRQDLGESQAPGAAGAVPSRLTGSSVTA